MEEQKGFLTQLQELDAPRKKRWTWGLSFLAVFAVLTMGWLGFTSMIRGTSERDKTHIPFARDIPVLEALRGSVISVGMFVAKGTARVWRTFTAPKTEVIIPVQNP